MKLTARAGQYIPLNIYRQSTFGLISRKPCTPLYDDSRLANNHNTCTRQAVQMGCSKEMEPFRNHDLWSPGKLSDRAWEEARLAWVWNGWCRCKLSWTHAAFSEESLFLCICSHLKGACISTQSLQDFNVKKIWDKGPCILVLLNAKCNRPVGCWG